MKNNDILRSLRYTFDFDDETMIGIFAKAELGVSRAEVCDWLKQEEEPEFKPISDFKLATFLNGLINHKRGKKEGKQPIPESRLTNNLILKKLKIALNLSAEDMLQILEKSGRKISPHELSAFFRNPNQSQYRLCKDQIMRNFLQGLQMVYRGN
jgi:uncharacterized protein YehS (DUF1456 family)